MARVGLTNFLLWGGAAVVFGTAGWFLPIPWHVVGFVALAVAWWTRFWPEGLGVAAGSAAALLLRGLWLPDHGDGDMVIIVSTVLLAATFVMWRVRLGAYIAVHAGDADLPAPPRDGTAKPLRLGLGTAVVAASLVPVQFLAGLGYWFAHCGTDTSPPPPPGSAAERHCQSMNDHVVLQIFGPSILLLAIGAVLASMRRTRLVLAANIVIPALTLATHFPDWLLN